jgi:predicted MFS family arabinose efflux permease
MLIFGLALDWAKVGSVSGNNAFDYFFTGGIAWLLVVAAGVIAVLLAVGAMTTGTTPWTLILVIATGLATLLMLIRLIMGAGDEAGFELDRGSGMYVAFIAAAIALAGAVMNFTTAGGRFSDLTDMDKMRDAFKGGPGGSAGQGSPPPPPPPPPAP